MTERFKVVASAHMLVLKDDTILMHKRMNTGYEDGNYSVPAGHHDPAERMTRTAIRELEEETGIVATDVEFGCVMHRIKPSGTESIDYFFLVREWAGEVQNREPDRCADLSFFPLDALPPNTIPYIRVGIDASLSRQTMVEYGWNENEI